MRGFTGQLPPARFNMADYCLGVSQARKPAKTALLVLRDADNPVVTESWSYAELEDAVLRVAHGLLDAGHAPGERLVIRLDNTSDYALLFFGAIAAGLVPLPASAALSAREVEFVLRDCGASGIAVTPSLPVGDIPSGIRVFEPGDIARLRTRSDRGRFADTARDDPAFLVYTSGTTASPKGVLHAQRSVWGRRPMYRGWYGIGPHDRMLHAGAFNWTYTLGTGLSDPWANGATSIVFTDEKDPALWLRIIQNHQPTIFAGVPSVYRQLLKYGDVEAHDLSSLRHGLTAGEHLPEAVIDDWVRRSGGVKLYEALGMSELSTFISSSPDVPPRQGAVGKAQQGRDVAIIPVDGGEEPLPPGETGLIAAHRSDPGLMLRYWERPDEQEGVFRGDWFIGGDLGVMDADGYITHGGRNDDIMNALGYRVSPNEIEEVLAVHPAVAESAVTEIAVRADLSVIGAFIVLREGVAASAAEIRDHAARSLASYKVPKEYVFLPELPHTPNGKVKRAELRRSYAERASPGGARRSL
ncbi:MAG: class I adenylate-forming enzyme family protein [Pseudomonadota bacterium]|nr:class I adenylate-forming enzyme family protein [Pseudomonadota bacterium]